MDSDIRDEILGDSNSDSNSNNKILKLEHSVYFANNEESFNEDLTKNLVGYRASVNLKEVDGFELLDQLINKFKDLYEESKSIDKFLVAISDYAGMALDTFVWDSSYLLYDFHTFAVLNLFDIKN